MFPSFFTTHLNANWITGIFECPKLEGNMGAKPKFPPDVLLRSAGATGLSSEGGGGGSIEPPG